MDFGRVILMTDLDGTLLTDDKRILPRDMEAIDRFRRGGGLFTVATGRGVAMARSAAQKLLLDMPAVIFNGAAVYDFAKDSFLWHCEIGSHAREYARRLGERFPDIGIEVLLDDKVYVPLLNETEQWHLDLEQVHPEKAALSEIPEGGWLKMLLAYPPEKMDEVVRFIEESDMDSAQWVRSAPMFYECLPKGIDKSAGFTELIRLTGAQERFTAAAGDFMNDTAMIVKADLGAAVASAQPEVKAAADIVVCDNNSGAIAELIDYIERI